MKFTIRSIDVGYGNVKFSTGNEECPFTLFPAHAVPEKNNKIAINATDVRDTVTVHVNGIDYETGPQIERALDSYSTKVLHSDYSLTDEYKTLMLGAIHYMNIERIDILVLGLPVNLFNLHHGKLKKVMEGTHDIAGRQVVIKHVKVVPQPVGGYVYIAENYGIYKLLQNQTSLVVDPGFHTTDWITCTGLTIHDARCGSFEFGTYRLINELSRLISAEIGTSYSNYTRLDQALRDNKPIKLNGKFVYPSQYLDRLSPFLKRPIDQMRENIGEPSDIENIFVVGGGASLFEPELKKHFPYASIRTDLNPVFANAKGFQMIGERIAKQLSQDES